MKKEKQHQSERDNRSPAEKAHAWRARQAEIKEELDRIDREIALHAEPTTPEHLRD